MEERGRNVRKGESRTRCESDDCASARPNLMPLMQQVRAGGPSYRSAVPMVIRHVEPAIRDFVRQRARHTRHDDSFVDDVVQDALGLVAIRVHQCRATTNRETMGWMLSVARTAMADALRREGPRTVSLEGARFDSVGSLSLDESIGRRPAGSPGLEILLRVVVEVSSELSTADATLLWLRLIAEEKWAAIGAALGISATAARRRFQRTQQSMRRRVHDALRFMPLAARRSAQEWLSKHPKGHPDANDRPVVEDPPD